MAIGKKTKQIVAGIATTATLVAGVAGVAGVGVASVGTLKYSADANIPITEAASDLVQAVKSLDGSKMDGKILIEKERQIKQAQAMKDAVRQLPTNIYNTLADDLAQRVADKQKTSPQPTSTPQAPAKKEEIKLPKYHAGLTKKAKEEGMRQMEILIGSSLSKLRDEKAINRDYQIKIIQEFVEEFNQYAIAPEIEE